MSCPKLFPSTVYRGFRIIQQPKEVFAQAIERCAGSILGFDHHASPESVGPYDTVESAKAEIDEAWADFGEPCAKCRPDIV
jgi:hypothetical protein